MYQRINMQGWGCGQDRGGLALSSEEHDLHLQGVCGILPKRFCVAQAGIVAERPETKEEKPCTRSFD